MKPNELVPRPTDPHILGRNPVLSLVNACARLLVEKKETNSSKKSVVIGIFILLIVRGFR